MDPQRQGLSQPTSNAGTSPTEPGSEPGWDDPDTFNDLTFGLGSGPSTDGASDGWAAQNSRLVSQWAQEKEQIHGGGWAPERVAAAAATSPGGGGAMHSAFLPPDPAAEVELRPDESGGPNTHEWNEIESMAMAGMDFLDSPPAEQPAQQVPINIGLGPARFGALPEPAPEPEPPTKRKDELIDFLEALNIPQFLPLFTRNELDLGALMLCTDDDLKEIGIPKGPRVKLRNGALSPLSKTCAVLFFMRR